MDKGSGTILNEIITMLRIVAEDYSWFTKTANIEKKLLFLQKTQKLEKECLLLGH